MGIGERTFFGARREFVFEVDRCSYLLFGNEESISAIGESKPFLSIVDVDAQLKARGIDLIVVPVPSREEIYADRIVPDFGEPGMISPYRVGFIRALLEADVEAVDLGPVFAEARDEVSIPLYRYADPHWSSRGMGVAAREIGARLARYSETFSGAVVDRSYHLIEAEIPNRSAIVRQMTDAFRERFRGVPWRVVRVVDEDGGAYADDDASPVLVMGDSYTAVLRDVNGHFNARLAKEIGMPLALLTQSGGGPTAPAALARKGSAFIEKRRVIVWVFSARYLVEPIAERWVGVELPE